MNLPQIVPHSDASTWSNNVFAFIAIINNSYLVYLLSRDYVHRKYVDDAMNSKRSRCELYISLLYTFIANILWAFWNMLLDFDVFHGVNCSLLYFFVTLLYYMGKFGIWAYSLFRLKNVFIVIPNFAYSNKFIYFLQSISAISAIFGIILLTLFSDTNREYYGVNKAVCNFIVYLWVLPIVGLLDGAISILIYYLFYRKMKQLTNSLSTIVDDNNKKFKNQKINGMNVDEQTYDLVYMTRKYAILLAASLLSTWFMLLFISVMPNINIIFASIDSIINMWCLLLFASKYDNIYLKIFNYKYIAKNRIMNQFEEQKDLHSIHLSSTTKDSEDTNETTKDKIDAQTEKTLYDLTK